MARPEDASGLVYPSVIEILPHLLFIFYETASARDLALRHDWLHDLVERLLREASRRRVDLRDCLQFVLKMSSVMRDALVQEVGSTGGPNAAALRCSGDLSDAAAIALPWDVRWLPGAAAGILRPDALADYAHHANRIALRNYFHFLRTIEDEGCSAQTGRDFLTVSAFSKAVAKGKLLQSITNHPLVVEFWPFLQHLDEYIEAVLTCSKVTVSNGDWMKLVPALSWRFHLAEQGNLHLTGETGCRLIDKAISCLSIHMQWLMKELLPPLKSLASNIIELENAMSNKRLSHSVDVIMTAISSSRTPLHRVGKRLRSIMGHPLPYSSEEQNHLAQRINRLSKLLTIWPTSDPTHMKLMTARVLFLVSDAGKETRQCLTNALRKLRNTRELEAVKENLGRAERLCKDMEHLFHEGPNNEQNVLPYSNDENLLLSSAKVQLWPIQEYLVVILGALFMKQSLLKINNYSSENNESFVSSCIAENSDMTVVNATEENITSSTLHFLLQNLPSIPPEMLYLINWFSTCDGNTDVPVCELMRMILLHFTVSPSRCLASTWLTWSPKMESKEKDTVEELITDLESSQNLLPMHCPILTTLVTNLVLPKEDNNHSVATELVIQIPLGAQNTTTTKLTSVLDILWRNMASLSSKSYNYQLNDAFSAHAAYLNLIQSLNQALAEVSKKIHTDLPVGESVSKKFEHLVCNQEDNSSEIIPIFEALRKLESVGTKLGTMLHENGLEAEIDMVIHTGETWLLVGCIEVFLLSKLEQFDPVEKKAVRLSYVTEEFKNTSQQLFAHKLQAQLSGVKLSNLPCEEKHPFISASSKHLSELTVLKTQLTKTLAFRPSGEPYYTELARDASHYSNTLGSPQMILGLQRRLELIHQQLLECIRDPVPTQARVHHLLSTAELLLDEERMWRNSQRIFCHRLQKIFLIHFPDQVTPILSAAQVLCHGAYLVASAVQKLLVRLKIKFADDIVKLVQFPMIMPHQGLPLHIVNLSLDHVFAQLLKQLLPEEEVSNVPIRRETYRLMKAGLQDLRNVLAVQGTIDVGTWNLFVKILSRITKIWMLESEEKKQKEKEKGEMYVQKGRTQCETLSDEKLIALGIQELFPTSIDEDFGDMQTELCLDLDSPPSPLPKEDSSGIQDLVSNEDMYFVCQLHWEVATSLTQTHWISSTPLGDEPNFVIPLLQRYQTFHQLLKHAAPGLDASVDRKLSPSLALLTSLALEIGKGKTFVSGDLPDSPIRKRSAIHKKTPDFYRDPNVEEVRQCIPILDAVMKHTQELLGEWPEHPALSQISVVIQRISSFPITSPVSRFLSGLEILLEKIHIWEENAHSGVSLRSHITLVTNQVISWRRLELHCWKECLSSAAFKMVVGASHWWFHIFLVVEEFEKKFQKDRLSSERDLINTLQEFMEKASLGDFHARLNILYSFHCHCVHLLSSNCQSLLVNIFWNIVQYYKQFSEAVDSRIQELKSPIEKKLRGYVKIARWNDINYWAVKKTVEKTRRTLLNYVREFESVLKQPVSSVITNPHVLSGNLATEGAGKLDKSKRRQNIKHSDVAITFYVGTARPLFLITANDGVQKSSLVSQAEMYYNKSRNLCKQALSSIDYPNLVKSLDDFTIDMIQTINYFKELEIPTDTPLNKRKSLAKSVLQQKKKALSDAFHSLQLLGLSYRTGMTIWSNADDAHDLFDFTLPPLDLNVGVQHSSYQLSGLLKSTMTESELAVLWDGSETYFYRSIARLSLLDTFLKKPHKDIGPSLIERLRGFPSHLMLLAKMQKEKLTNYFDMLRTLRCYISQLSLLKRSNSPLPKQSDMKQKWHNLNSLLVKIIISAEQFLVYIRACPSGTPNSWVVQPSDDLTSNMSSAILGDDCWQTVKKKLKAIISSASTLKNNLNKSWVVFPDTEMHSSGEEDSDIKLPPESNLITPTQFEMISEGYERVVQYLKDVKNIRNMFENSKEVLATNPMTENLRALEELMEKELLSFREMQDSNVSSRGIKISGNDIENKELEICLNRCEDAKLGSVEIPLNTNDDSPSNKQWNIHISLSDKHITEEKKREVVDEFLFEAENVLKTTLISIQKIYKKYSGVEREEKPDIQVNLLNNFQECQNLESCEEADFTPVNMKENHLKEMIVNNLLSDLSDLSISRINKMLNKLIQRLIILMELEGWEKEANECKGFLWTCIPCINQLSLLFLFFVTQQAAAYRITTKLMSVILSISIDLAQKGFCIPPELMPNEGEEDGDPKGGMGLGEGEGEKDVSDKIESEDQLEDAKKSGDDDNDDKDCKEEEKGIETSQDFGGKIQDVENNDEDDDEKDPGEDEEEPDKEMGETGEGGETLDQEVWGSDSENDEDEDQEEKEDQHGDGEQTGNPEMAARDDKKNRDPNEDDDNEPEEKDDRQEEAKDINEFDEALGEDHVDPHHGKHQPPPEPEPFELPDDLQLDDDVGKEDKEEENPFDIDAMKEPKLPEDIEEGQEGEEEEGEKATEEPGADSSEEEEEKEGEGKDGNRDVEEEDDHDVNDGATNETGEKDEGKDNEKDKEEKTDKIQEDQAMPSDDLPSQDLAQSADMETQTSNASKDKVADNSKEQKDDGKQDAEDLGEEGGDEEEGVGQAQAEEQKSGHRGHLTTPKEKLPSQNPNPEPEPKVEKRQRPGESDQNRTLGKDSEPTVKRLKTLEITDQEGEKEEGEETEPENAEEGKKADMYKHIKDAKETFDTHTLDAATKEQAEKQPVPNKEDEPSEEPTNEDDIVNEDEIVMEEDIEQQNPEKFPSNKKQKEKNTFSASNPEDEEGDEDMTVEIEGEEVFTVKPMRKAETTFYTQLNLETDNLDSSNIESHLQAVREELEKQLATWTQAPADAEAAKAWQDFLTVTSALSRELSEQLRLVLEPTQAARLRGDYRTGRRINMRKVIPYIASQFRKDKIWLRRTKPSKREYQVVLAIDDSSSMADNHTKELAFESLALVSRALSLLEAGDLAVVSFGETPRILHQLGETFSEHNGGRLLQEFSFTQKHTKVGQLVDFCTMLLRESRLHVSSSCECAQLLMIVSDGRGVFSEGDEKVRLAIRHARQNRIFMVFVILDNPESKNSILDIRSPVFQGGKLLGIKSYLDSFPFPFYLILQDINCLPAVLSDALRQWFELVTNTDAI